jgi:hypothetical protein
LDDPSFYGYSRSAVVYSVKIGYSCGGMPSGQYRYEFSGLDIKTPGNLGAGTRVFGLPSFVDELRFNVITERLTPGSTYRPTLKIQVNGSTATYPLPSLTVEKPKPAIEACVSVGGASTGCKGGDRWSAQVCLKAGNGAVLQAKTNAGWRTVLRNVSRKEKCAPGKPWALVVNGPMADQPGTEQYRFLVPASGGVAKQVVPVTVTYRNG